MKSFQITSSQTLTLTWISTKILLLILDIEFVYVLPQSGELTETKSVPCISSAMCTIRHSLKVSLKVKVKSLSSLQLCDSMDCSLPGFSIHGIFQARVPKWVAISFSKGSFWPRDQTWVSQIAGRRFTLWAIIKKHKNAFCILEKSNTSFTCGQNIEPL